MRLVIGVEFLFYVLFDLTISARGVSEISYYPRFLISGKNFQAFGKSAMDRFALLLAILMLGLIPVAAIAQSEGAGQSYTWTPFGYSWGYMMTDGENSPRYTFSSAADACTALGGCKSLKNAALPVF